MNVIGLDIIAKSIIFPEGENKKIWAHRPKGPGLFGQNAKKDPVPLGKWEENLYVIYLWLETWNK
jgi:hypothetical protein